MKKLALLFLVSILLVWCGQFWNNGSSLLDSKDKKDDIAQETKSEKTPVSQPKKLIALMDTTCPHCKNEIPVLDRFYKQYKDRVTMQVIITNAERNGQSKFAGNYQIPQETDPEKVKLLTYTALTGEACGYVPSFVIFNEKNEIEEKICGGALTYEELEEKLLFENVDELSALQGEGWKKDDLGVIMTTSLGKIEIKVFPQQTPKTVENFLALSEKWYYDGLTFHRVIKDFMIQWGDPNGNGTGGESIYGGKFRDEFHPELKNFPGALAMANSGANTNGSQFFINQVRNAHLDNRHSVFGQVVDGMDVVNAIIEVEAKDAVPVTPVTIEKIEVVQYDGTQLQPFVYDFEARQQEKENKTVQEGDMVSLHYILTTPDSGDVVENSRDSWDPIEFIVSDDAGLLPAFVEGVKGMKIGEKKNIEIPATHLVTPNTHPMAGKDLQFELELVDIK